MYKEINGEIVHRRSDKERVRTSSELGGTEPSNIFMISKEHAFNPLSFEQVLPLASLTPQASFKSALAP